MLNFIKNQSLNSTIENSFKYMSTLLIKSKKEEISELYKEENYRVIILYIVAIIEAILLYVLKERGEKIITTVYKFPNEISKKVKHTDYPDETVVTAVKINKVKDEKEIGVQNLVQFMTSKKLMHKITAEKILEINDIRNTFHLSKCRNNIRINTNKVEKALDLLLKIIQGGSRAISYNKMFAVFHKHIAMKFYIQILSRQ